jgi:hypothetical protein
MFREELARNQRGQAPAESESRIFRVFPPLAHPFSHCF